MNCVVKSLYDKMLRSQSRASEKGLWLTLFTLLICHAEASYNQIHTGVKVYDECEYLEPEEKEACQERHSQSLSKLPWWAWLILSIVLLIIMLVIIRMVYVNITEGDKIEERRRERKRKRESSRIMQGCGWTKRKDSDGNQVYRSSRDQAPRQDRTTRCAHLLNNGKAAGDAPYAVISGHQPPPTVPYADSRRQYAVGGGEVQVPNGGHVQQVPNGGHVQHDHSGGHVQHDDRDGAIYHQHDQRRYSHHRLPEPESIPMYELPPHHMYDHHHTPPHLHDHHHTPPHHLQHPHHLAHHAVPTEEYGHPADSYGHPADNYGHPADNYGHPADNYGHPADSQPPPIGEEIPYAQLRKKERTSVYV